LNRERVEGRSAGGNQLADSSYHDASAAPNNALSETSQHMKKIAIAFVRDEQGQDLIEHALLAALISVGSDVAIGSLAEAVTTLFIGPVKVAVEKAGT
jgi:Flp pilus assembly pilin Flp